MSGAPHASRYRNMWQIVFFDLPVKTKADRRLGAKLYAATIASGLVHHQKLISEQAPTRILQAFIELDNDDQLPKSIRTVARRAIESLAERG